MAAKLTDQGRQAVNRLVAFQALLVVFMTITGFVLGGMKAGVSACVGGVSFVAPNAVFGYAAFLFAGARQAKMVVYAFFFGEVMKMVLTIVILAVALQVMDVSAVIVLVCYVIALCSQWLAPLFFRKTDGTKHGCTW